MKQYFLGFFSKEQEIVVLAQWFDFYLKTLALYPFVP